MQILALLVLINDPSREMGTLFKYPTSNEVDLPDAVTREVNNAVANVLAEKRNGASRIKQKYTHFTL